MKKTTLFCFLMLLLCLQQVKAQTYRVGDVIQNDDGSIGVVFYVNFDKTGGWMVALEDVSTGCPWGTANNIPNLTDYNPGDFFYQILLTDLDGLANTQTIRAYQNNNANYAAGKMEINHGWYLPSCGQLEYLYTALPFIEASITALGGATLVEDCYWSSTERTAENAWVVRFGSNNNIGGCIYSFPKTENYPVRAIRDFTMVPPSTGNVAYLWNTGATTQDITVSPSQTSTYSVVVTIDDGNEASAQKTITVNHADTVNYYISSCGNYTWHDQTYSTSGQYAHETTNEDGCYRLELLHLTISEGYREEYHEEECDSYLWPVNHQWYYQSVLDSIVVEGQQGSCDSTFVLDLTIHYGDTLDLDPVEACDRYEWHGQTYAQSGQLTFLTTNEFGCSRLERLALTVNHSDTVTFNITSCGEYEWHEQTYGDNGQYAHETTNEHGCYRLELLNLTISDSYRQVDEVSECEGYLWPVNHQWYYESVLDSIVVEGQQGTCDSTFVLDLTINHGYHEEYNVTSCEPYEWHGTLYAESGTYPIEVEGPNGCDSVLVLNLQLSGNLSASIVGRTAIYPATDIISGIYPYYVDSTNVDPAAVHWAIDRDDWYVLPHGASCELVCTSAGWGELRAWTEGGECSLDTTLVINASFFGVGEDNQPNVNVYPNPTGGRVVIEGHEITEVRLLELTGREMARYECGKRDTCVMDVSRCPAGMYLLEVRTTLGKVMRKLIIER